MKKILRAFMISFAFLGVTTAPAFAQSYTDMLIQDFKFRFRPNVLQAQEGNTGFVQGLYIKTPDFPLWLLIDMGGDLLVDKDHFQQGEMSKDDDGIWMVETSCVDSINGYFSLNFAVDSKTGEAALRIADFEEDLVLYSGKIMGYADEKPTFRNEKRQIEALEMETYLDKVVPELAFTIRLNSELYGVKAQVSVTPNGITTNAPQTLDSEKFETVCCERQGDYWLLRFKIGEFAEVLDEDMLMDLAINAYTGDVNYRMSLADRLKVNWRSIVDGRVIIPKK